MNRTPSPSWETVGLRSRLAIGAAPGVEMVAEVEPAADLSGYLWEIRGMRQRRTTTPLARIFTKLPSLAVAQLDAEDALRNLALELLARFGIAPAPATRDEVARLAHKVGGEPMRSGETGEMLIAIRCGHPAG